MKYFFLFQNKIDADCSPRQKVIFWCWNIGMILLSGLGITLCSLWLGLGPYEFRLAEGYVVYPLIFFLNLFPVLLLILLFYGITGRSGLSFGLTSGIVIALSLGDYYKLMFRNDPLMFADLFLLKEAGNMAGKYQLFISKRIAIVIFFIAIGALFFHFFVRGTLPKKGRVILTSVGMISAALLSPVILSVDTYNRTAYYDLLPSRLSATQQYIAHGSIYPFLHSISGAIMMPPRGYDEQKVKNTLAQYVDQDIPEDQKVNIIGIMLEAYNDFTKFGVPELATDVYEVWHALEDEGYSGDLLTNIFAGGTVNTERCFLTGFSSLPNFRGPTNSYVWYFRSQGYQTEGMHPCFDWFYNRLNINEYLGFQNYYFVENYFGELTGNDVGMDRIFFPELIKSYQAATTDGTPYFNFSITYQGHGPYNNDICWWGNKGDFVKDDGTYTEEQQYILDNYFGSIYDTNQHLKELTDYLRKDDAPVILILFGDHNPWMGDGNSVYDAMGINFDLSTPEGFYNYYSTRYIIWANDAAKAKLGTDLTGEGPTISPNYLMQELFDLCGWDGPASMRALREVKAQIPVINIPTQLYVEKNIVTDTLSDHGQALIDRYNSFQYYYQKHFLYTNTK